MRILLLITLTLIFSHASAVILKEKIIIGRVEWVELPDLKIKYKARVDTGAKTTSLHAMNIEEIKRDGQLYIKFQTEDGNGKLIELNRKVESTQRVTSPSGFSSKRYVIREKVKLGQFEMDLPLNLNNRNHMDYKFLVGRNFLFGRFVVDVARSHVLGD